MSKLAINSLLIRACDAPDAHAEAQTIVRELRDENLRKGGDDRFFGQLLCAHLAFMIDAIPAITPGAADAPSEPAAPQGQSSEPTPWVSLRSQGQAEAWIAKASEEELRAMYERLLSGRPVSAEEFLPQRLISLAISASAKLWRRVLDAQRTAQWPRYRFRAREFEQGSRS